MPRRRGSFARTGRTCAIAPTLSCSPPTGPCVPDRSHLQALPAAPNMRGAPRPWYRGTRNRVQGPLSCHRFCKYSISRRPYRRRTTSPQSRPRWRTGAWRGAVPRHRRERAFHRASGGPRASAAAYRDYRSTASRTAYSLRRTFLLGLRRTRTYSISQLLRPFFISVKTVTGSFFMFLGNHSFGPITFIF